MTLIAFFVTRHLATENIYTTIKMASNDEALIDDLENNPPKENEKTRKKTTRKMASRKDATYENKKYAKDIESSLPSTNKSRFERLRFLVGQAN